MGFFTNIKRNIIKSFGNIRLYNGGIVFWGKSGYRINGTDQRQILDELQPGDIIFRRYKHYIGSILVPGYWSHVGLYIGEPYYIIHAAGGGVIKEDILTFMRTDSLALMRCMDGTLIKPAIEYTKEKLDAQTPYDYDFMPENDALYCSELIWECFDKPECTKYKGKYVIPDDILSVEHFEMIHDIRH